MRAITTAQQAVLDSATQAEHARLLVKDADGNWRDLTTWPGFDAVEQLTWRGEINDPHMTFDAVLSRELFQLSLSPFMEQSALNHAFDQSAAFKPLLALNREVRIDVAIVPMDTAPVDGDWMTVFHGRIDDLDVARGQDIQISGRDTSGRLAQQYIKKERVYAFAKDGSAMVSLRLWAPEMSVASGEYVLPASRGADDPGYNKFFKCDTTGVTGTEEPEWTTGADQVDGSARFDYVGAPDLGGFPAQEVIQKILNDNRLTGDPAITLYTPDDPLWDVYEFLQQRGFTLEAVRALASQIGWDLRMKWKAGDSAFAFTLYEPQREDPPVLHSFSPDDYAAPTKLGQDISELRNSVTIIFKDRTDLYPDGTPKRKEIEASDPDSIAELDQELWSELQQDELGNIDTPAEAERLAAAFISDCSSPTAEFAAPLVRGFPWVELNDFYRFEADDVRSSLDLELAVTSWTHEFADGALKTSLQLRGKPTAGHLVHIKKEHHPDKPPKATVHRLTHFAQPLTITPQWIPVVGGVQVVLEGFNATKEQLLNEYEIHISDEPDFVPSELTLVAVMKGNEATVPYQNPAGPNGGDGGDYYGTAIPRWYNAGELVRGQPSKRKAFKAGRAKTAHLESGPRWGRQPLNGGFETRFDPADTSQPPDHWQNVDGWGTNIVEGSGPDGVSGERWLVFNCDYSGDPPDLLSSPFQVEAGRQYRGSWWLENYAEVADGALELYVKFFDDEACTNEVAETIIDEADLTNPLLNIAVWRHRGAVFTCDVAARYGRVGVRVSQAGACDTVYVDSIEVHPWDPGAAGVVLTPPSGATTTRSSFATLYSLPVQLKEVGGTALAMFALSCFSTVATTVVEVRLKLTGTDGSVDTGQPVQFLFNEANAHRTIAGIAALFRPTTAGTFAALADLSLEWRRVSGSGTVTINSSDSLSLGIV